MIDTEYIDHMEKLGEDALISLAEILDIHRVTFTPRDCRWDVVAYSGTGINAKRVLIEIKMRDDELDLALYYGPYLMYNKHQAIMEEVKQSIEPTTPLFFNFSKDGLLIFEIKPESAYTWKRCPLPKGCMNRQMIETRIDQLRTEQYNAIKMIRF
jgi:hypothetical protein